MRGLDSLYCLIHEVYQYKFQGTLSFLVEDVRTRKSLDSNSKFTSYRNFMHIEVDSSIYMLWNLTSRLDNFLCVFILGKKEFGDY